MPISTLVALAFSAVAMPVMSMPVGQPQSRDDTLDWLRLGKGVSIERLARLA
ncbi:hypothetical protein AcW1_008811 [Taiwanofungus camphoratus]|nr:hypothetical protein AcV5_006840 [Antrodia cinnamomea]KAI0935208.1 hypothetical protein AcV7_003705 [Antrodia cinnamomea]KAI0949111.1 hypothetical protein AcW1_008811 [Antrodia cinnamomea]